MPSDNLTVAPDFPIAEIPEYKTIVSQFENGSEQRRSKFANSIRSWKLSFRNRPESEYDTVVSLFDSMKGRLTSWLWTNPLDGIQYTVRFDVDNIEYSEKAYGVYDFSFTIKQVV